MNIFPIIRLRQQHKFVRMLKKFLNELVTPNPKLPDNDLFDAQTQKAVIEFKKQWFNLLIGIHKGTDSDAAFKNMLNPGVDFLTWSMIGRAFANRNRLLEELRETNDNELRSLLLGMLAAQGNSSYYTTEMEACDAKIASIFGGKNAIAAANGFEPDSLAIIRAGDPGQPFPYYRGDEINYENKLVPGHLSNSSMHLYGSTDGTRFGVDGNTFTEIYVPDGFAHPEKVRKVVSPTQASVDFYYKKLGSLEDVTLLVSHIKDYRLEQEDNRWHLGKIGGIGGDGFGYIHSHLDLFRGDVGMTGKRIRLAFSKAFCG